jgi:hypothetical protein
MTEDELLAQVLSLDALNVLDVISVMPGELRASAPADGLVVAAIPYMDRRTKRVLLERAEQIAALMRPSPLCGAAPESVDDVMTNAVLAEYVAVSWVTNRVLPMQAPPAASEARDRWESDLAAAQATIAAAGPEQLAALRAAFWGAGRVIDMLPR